MATDPTTEMVTFIQYDIPPLRADVYTLKAEQTVPNQSPGTFPVQNTYVVQGERYSFAQQDIYSVFPPDNANGSFDGVLPHVVFNRRTLPWEREIKYGGTTTYPTSAWLAVLLFNEGQQPKVTGVQAQDLIPKGQSITVTGSTQTGTGTLEANYLSYGNGQGNTTLNPMGYGELPTTACNIIDIPLALFNQIAPAAQDIQYLAHIRHVDVTDGVNSTTTSQEYAVVVGNRIPQVNTSSYAYLVSLENFADYLPDEDGKPSSNIPTGVDTIRLLCYRSWSYTANNLDQSLEALLENLNKPQGVQGLTTLQLPLVGDAPTAQEVEAATSAQATGTITDAQATVLVQNALTMGYVPCDHHLRHGGNTVSMYRGPLAPYPIATTIQVPFSNPDAANNYDPETGIFDVTYGMAWQMGQLLMLQNTGVANQLYQWKRMLKQQEVIAAEQVLINEILQHSPLFQRLLQPRLNALAATDTTLPSPIQTWFGRLGLLIGVPFNYLVPDENLLPTESLRFFYLDENWIETLVDGAFSIGNTTTGEGAQSATYLSEVRTHRLTAMRRHRKNVSPALRETYENSSGQVTGFILRSQAVSGWPNLRAKAYSDLQGTNEIPPLHIVNLSDTVLFGLFDGVIKMFALQEPPEQLHMGVEGKNGVYSTTLRSLEGSTAGQQFTSVPKKVPASPCNLDGSLPIACISARTDQQTLQIFAAAQTIQSVLASVFSQTISPFTSAEFALEMTKGVVKVEYQNTTN